MSVGRRDCTERLTRQRIGLVHLRMNTWWGLESQRREELVFNATGITGPSCLRWEAMGFLCRRSFPGPPRWGRGVETSRPAKGDRVFLPPSEHELSTAQVQWEAGPLHFAAEKTEAEQAGGIFPSGSM